MPTTPIVIFNFNYKHIFNINSNSKQAKIIFLSDTFIGIFIGKDYYYEEIKIFTA